jgi:pimeloyl-ACP methyl ester carboxylesterase
VAFLRINLIQENRSFKKKFPRRGEKMPYFESFDGTRIHYELYPGSKPYTLFVLHGWTAQAPFYRFLLPYLKDFTVVLWDARCHGQSQVDFNATVQDMAKDFRHFLQYEHKSDNAVVPVGHSMGALTLMEYVKQFGTDMLHKMVIVDQSPKLMTDNTWDLGIYGDYPSSRNEIMIKHFEKDLGIGVIKLGTSGLNLEYNRLFEKKPEFFYERKRVFTPEQEKGMIHIWKSLTQADYREVVSHIDIPVLLLYGLKSQYYKKETAYFMKDQIPNATLHFLEKGDHSPFIQETDKFTEYIKEFVESD